MGTPFTESQFHHRSCSLLDRCRYNHCSYDQYHMLAGYRSGFLVVVDSWLGPGHVLALELELGPGLELEPEPEPEPGLVPELELEPGPEPGPELHRHRPIAHHWHSSKLGSSFYLPPW